MSSSEKLCRVCTKNANTCVNMYENDCDSIQYVYKLRLLFTELVLDDDTTLPVCLCTDCCEKLKNAYNFKKLCISSMEFWRKYREHQKDSEDKHIQSVENSEQPTMSIEFIKTEIVPNDVDENKNVQSENFHNFSGDELQRETSPNLLDIVKTEITTPENSSGEDSDDDDDDVDDDDDCDEGWEQESQSTARKKWKSKVMNQLDFNTCENREDEVESTEVNSSSVPKLNFRKVSRLKPFPASVDPSTYVLDMKSKIFVCKTCDKNFTSRKSLRKHVQRHDISSHYPCTVCPKSFRTKGSLSQHMKFHSEKRPHMCDICGKGFVMLSGLKTHLLMHSDEKKFECRLCQKRFKAPASLKIHMDKHSQRTFNCEACNRTFPKYDSYYWHKKKTHGEKRIRCHICDMTFHMKTQLTSHLKSHTNENAVNCEVCKKQFASKQGLKRHMRTHTGERPYMCKVCKKSFAHSANLQVHMRIHEGDPTYHFWCKLCDKGFILSYHYEKHMKKLHTDVREEIQPSDKH